MKNPDPKRYKLRKIRKTGQYILVDRQIHRWRERLKKARLVVSPEGVEPEPEPINLLDIKMFE